MRWKCTEELPASVSRRYNKITIDKHQMSHTPFLPNKLGITELKNISLREVMPYIDWTFFFMAWRLTGKFEDIAEAAHCDGCKIAWLQKLSGDNRLKAEEALKLYKEAEEMLSYLNENKLTINAIVGLFNGYAANDDIYIQSKDESIVIPVLRQQHRSNDGFCYSLADFLAPENDYIGAFVTTVIGGEELAEKFEKENDVYRSILLKTLCDRIAEATAEWLHHRTRKDYWGYASEENLSISDMLKTKYKGIRPAVGYPSLPDQSVIFSLASLLKFESIGIQVTENGAMYPNASVCGLYFSHPLSKYFMVGKIDEIQLEDYSKRRGKRVEEMKKWLIANI
jgi:cobalamin-dependent methionine synthase I